jgi:hypothetical protein
MSLLSETRGTPRTVWSLIKLLSSHNGELELEAVWGWLDPFDTGIDEHGEKKSGSAVEQTLGAATSLNLIEVDRNTNRVRLTVSDVPLGIDAFSDWVHDRLTRIPLNHPDSVVLEAFAWIVASCAKSKGTNWIRVLSRNQFADAVNSALMSDQGGVPGDPRFNPTKVPYWRDWIGFVGLGLDMPTSGRTGTFYPYVTERLEREVKKIGDGLSDKVGQYPEIEATEFLTSIAKLMPYLDGGAHFALAAKRIGWNPTRRQLSIVASTALRELHDDGVLELKMYGDARDAYTLATDPTHKLEAFRTVMLKDRGHT